MSMFMISSLLALVTLTVTTGPVTIDWTAGIVQVEAGVGPSLRAPNPQVARVSSEREAMKIAQQRLWKAIEKLPVAGGGTAGERLGKNADARAALDKDISALAPIRMRHASDGGIEIQLRLPIRRIAAAVGGAVGTSDGKVTMASGPRVGARIAVVKGKLEPALVPDGDLRFFRSVAEAKKEKKWLGGDAQVINIERFSDTDLRGGPVAVIIDK
jgi:hypothetical protein